MPNRCVQGTGVDRRQGFRRLLPVGTAAGIGNIVTADQHVVECSGAVARVQSNFPVMTRML